MVVDGRSQAQSRAAADAGMAEVVGALKRGDLSCPAAGVVLTDTNRAVAGAGTPRYDYRVTCGAGTATVSVFSEVGGGRPRGAVGLLLDCYAVRWGDMVFFGTGNVTFTYEVATSASGRLLDIVVPQASFTCQALIPGNITASGDVKANGGCTIKGKVVSGGSSTCAAAQTPSKATSQLPAPEPALCGEQFGQLHANGSLDFGWENKIIGGSVTANGNVSLGNVKIGGALTVPSGRSLSTESGTVLGGTVRPATVPGPASPTLPPWFEYKFAASDWPAHRRDAHEQRKRCRVLCFVQQPSGDGLDRLGELLDADDHRRARSRLSAATAARDVAVKTNIVLLAKKFDLTTLTVKAATGVATKPNLWVMTEDVTPADAKPTCGSGYGDLVINGTVMATSVKAMAYTPCKINVAGGAGGVHDSWNGNFYGGAWNYGGGLTFTADPLAVPGMAGSGTGGASAGSMGGLVSQRDIPYEDLG